MRLLYILAFILVVSAGGALARPYGWMPQYNSSNPPPTDPCDPNYPSYYVNQVTAMLARQECAREQQQQQQNQVEDQQRQAAAREAQADARLAADEQRRAITKAETRGYKLILSIKDLILDGKSLAAESTKIQVSGIYKKIGEGNGALYESMFDAYQGNDNYVPLLTDGAQRDLREYLMSYGCNSEVGCQVDLGGHMAMCKHLNALMADYPDMPCLNVEVEIVYRAGD